MIDTGDTDYSINGSNSVLMGYKELMQQDLKFDLTNFTINFTSHGGSQSNLKTILMFPFALIVDFCGNNLITAIEITHI